MTQNTVSGAGLSVMEQPSRGATLRKRRTTLGWSQDYIGVFAEEQKLKPLSRSAVAAAEDDRAADTTYDRYDAILALGEEIRRSAVASGELHILDDDETDDEPDLAPVRVEPQLVEIELSEAEAHVTVRGPVRTAQEREELENSAVRILAKWRKGQTA